MALIEKISIITAVNNQDVLKINLLCSSYLADKSVSFISAAGFQNAGSAYNYGIQKASGEILIFAHQDVYLPSGWCSCLEKAICDLKDRAWAVIGIIGAVKGGQVAGRTWSTGLGREVGCRLSSPVPVESIDELLIVINRKSGLRFDDRLPGFHLYGTDIVQTAKQQGWESYVIDAPVIHNSLPVTQLDQSFRTAYHYMQKKWKNKLPIQTLVTKITPLGIPLYRSCFRYWMKNQKSRETFKRREDPRAKAIELGYE